MVSIRFQWVVLTVVLSCSLHGVHQVPVGCTYCGSELLSLWHPSGSNRLYLLWFLAAFFMVSIRFQKSSSLKMRSRSGAASMSTLLLLDQARREPSGALTPRSYFPVRSPLQRETIQW